MEISNFKYTLQINQKAIIDNKLDIDIIDASIFDFIHYFQSSPKTKKMVDNGTQYFYLHWSKIVEQIPLLGINSRQGVYKRLQNLINAKLIKAHEENGKGTGLMWFCLGENYDLMFVANGNENYNLTTKVTKAVNESLQVNQKAVNESLPYNTISKKDNTISNTTTTKEKIEVVEVPDFVKKEQEEKRKLAEEYTAGKLDEEQTREELYKDEKTRMSFKRLLNQYEYLSNIQTTEKAFIDCFKSLIDETVHNASIKDDFPRSLVKSREHFKNFSNKLASEQPERFKKLLIPR